MSRWASLAFGLSLAACDGSEPPRVDVSGLDPGFFECEIQPILDRECAFSGCHGDPGRALFVYSMSKRRELGAESIGDPLTDREVCSNFYRTASFSADPVESSQLITKPATLSTARSLFHEGNYMFGAEDVEASCFRAWLSGELHQVGEAKEPPLDCRLPWRVAADGHHPKCQPRPLDCARVLGGS
ncbi:MAG: hypothetical protein HY791_03805 [Deltaproteobacteria bacterium]|nr:hypothetical protein [Deltaproteobacteria bacterium]